MSEEPEEGEQMKAIAKTKPGVGLDLIQVPDPTPAPDEVVLKVLRCGIDGPADAGMYEWGPEAEMMMGPLLPIIIGHEILGEIVSVGSDVRGWRPGSRVVLEPTISCSRCHYCLDGRQNLCTSVAGLIGITKNGGMAEYVAVPQQVLIEVPETLSNEEAVILEPMGVAVHAMEQAPVDIGDPVAIIGAGFVGLMLLQFLKMCGANPVIVIGTQRSQKRLQIAKELGADLTLIAGKDDVTSQVAEASGGLGVKVVFEAAGKADALLQGLQLLRSGGRICLIGSTRSTVEIAPLNMLLREVSVVTSRGRRLPNWLHAIQLATSQRITLKPFKSLDVPLEATVETIRKITQDRSIVHATVNPWHS